jgi:hypothetical protein
MSMQRRTLRILEEASFTAPQAVALAEAIEEELHVKEMVTVPILDTRLGDLESKCVSKLEFQTGMASLRILISESEVRTFHKMISLGLAATSLIITATFFIVLNLKK